jgi:hypothetical protein
MTIGIGVLGTSDEGRKAKCIPDTINFLTRYDKYCIRDTLMKATGLNLKSWKARKPIGLRKRCAHSFDTSGWMTFDSQHANAAENTKPGGANNWRATAWEIHPVTDIQIAQAPE